jgi:hypothetical protein
MHSLSMVALSAWSSAVTLAIFRSVTCRKFEDIQFRTGYRFGVTTSGLLSALGFAIVGRKALE